MRGECRLEGGNRSDGWGGIFDDVLRINVVKMVVGDSDAAVSRGESGEDNGDAYSAVIWWRWWWWWWRW